MSDSVSAISQAFLPISNALWKKLHRIYKEHQAGRTPFGPTEDRLEKGMEETIRRLVGGKIEDAWWRRTLENIQHQYIAPDFLRIHAIRDWLSDSQVQSDFKSLARERIMGSDDLEQNAWNRLSQSYSEFTGEIAKLAQGPIDVITAIIASGYFGSISSQLEPIAGMVQNHAQETRKGFQNLDGKLGSIVTRIEEFGPDKYTIEAHSKRAKYELDQLLKRRSLDSERTIREIVALNNRVINSDLTHTANSVKAEILYWAARLHASKTGTLPLTRNYLTQLIDINPEADTRIIDALILETEGNVDTALRILRDIDTPDGHSTFFIVCSRRKGEENALLWFDEQSEHDSPKFFTPIGWTNIAITFANNGRWSEGAYYLGLVHDNYEQWPDLVFVEGVINAAILLPEEIRPYALEMNLFHPTIRTIEGNDTVKYRARSKDCFQTAHKLLLGIEQKGRAQAALDWHLWLRLTDPIPQISNDAKRELYEGMKVLPRALDLMPFAHTFGVEFDEGPIIKYISKRKRTGGLENRELLAELFLFQTKKTPKEFAEFIRDEEDRLIQVVSKATLSGLYIEAIAGDGQAKRAREILEERKDDLVDNDYLRLLTLIDTIDGEDPREKLEDIYAQTGSIIDLKNLINHLKKMDDWKSLQPRLESLFQKEKTSENALKLIYCYKKNTQIEYTTILKFLGKNHDLVSGNYDLLSEKAWILSSVGRVKEADEINTELLKSRNNENDLELNINIALQLGDWDRFSLIIDDALKRYENPGTNLLIRLASLAAEVDANPDRAMELSKIAVEKGSDDPQILMQAYILAVQLGREDQTSAEWFAKTIEMSSDDGPLMKVDIRTVAEEMIPAQTEKAISVEKALMKGELSIQAAANHLGQTISRILIEIPKRNANLQDGRRRTIVPIRSGSRAIVDIKAEWKVCFDITSIMILEHLNLLEKTFNAFEKIILDPDTMIFLLNERRRARYHQPFRIQKAEDFRSLIDQNLLKITPKIPDTPKDLIDQVGKDFAEMLELARTMGGLVIRPFPIFKSGSFMAQEANIGDYADYVISTKSFVKYLYEDRGLIDSNVYENAYRYLAVQDQGGKTNEDQTTIDGPLLLDDLSITYLQNVDLLRIVCNCGFDLFVHPSMLVFQSSLIEEGRGGIRLAESLNNIKMVLTKFIVEGKVIFLKRPRLVDKDGKYQFFHQIAPTVANILEDTGKCDAVCIDDRFFNKHKTILNKKDRTVPIVCVTDILQYLENHGAITTNQMHYELHKLRQTGFALIPMPFMQIEWYLNNVKWDQDGHLIESAEMRIMRQTLMRIRGLDILVLPDESPFLEQIQLGCVFLVRRLWSNEQLSAEKAAVLSNWIWNNIAPCPLDWVKNNDQSNKNVLEGFSQHYSFLLKPMNLNKERYTEYLKWLEKDIFEPLLLANVHYIDFMSIIVRNDIESMIEEIPNEPS